MRQQLPAKLHPLVIVVGALASMATSQAESGDRANGGDGDCIVFCEDDDPGPTCPAGEVCSDLTPYGLYFTGMKTGDVGPFQTSWAHPTAVGGEQTVRIFLDADATMPLDLPFAASLASSALRIIDQGDASVRLAGISTGSPKLRITEPDSDLLYDRITVDSTPVARMQLVPAGQYLFGNLDLRDGETPFAVLVGRTTRVTAQLLTSNDARVVDESMRFDLSATVGSDPQGFADTVALTADAAGAVEVIARSGEMVGSMSVMAVAAADRIDLAYGETPLRIAVAQPGVFCFQAMAGEAAVVGVGWTYRGSSRLSMAPAQDDVAQGCIEITGTEPGNASLTVEGAGASTELAVEIVEGRSSAARRTPGAEPVEQGLGGDRTSL